MSNLVKVYVGTYYGWYTYNEKKLTCLKQLILAIRLTQHRHAQALVT